VSRSGWNDRERQQPQLGVEISRSIGGQSTCPVRVTSSWQHCIVHRLAAHWTCSVLHTHTHFMHLFLLPFKANATTHCRVLPPGKFNGITPESFPIYSDSFMVTALTVFM